jgi:hypothetical protein
LPSTFHFRPCVLSLVPFIYVAGGNPRIYPPLAENAAQGKKGHFRMDTISPLAPWLNFGSAASQTELKNNALLSDDNMENLSTSNDTETGSFYGQVLRHQRNASMNDIQNALRILGLGVHATEPEIKQTYRDLAKVWHPDRFPNDPGLRLKAQDKLKEINGAYSILHDYRPRRETGAREEGASRSDRRASTAAASEAERKHRSSHSPPRSAPSNTTSILDVEIRIPRWAYILGLVLAAIGTVGYVVHETGHEWLPHLTAKNPSDVKTAKVNSGSLVPREPAPALQKTETAVFANPLAGDPVNLQARSTPPSRQDISSPLGLNSEYFTVDSTREEVLAVQGTPTEADDRVFTYGDSKVYFSDGRVTRWDNSLSHPLKTKVLPSKPNMPNKGYFTVGSKKEEVLAVQGIPTGFDDRSFAYGSSKVYFNDGRVTRWDVQADYPLKVRSVTAGQSSSGN